MIKEIIKALNSMDVDSETTQHIIKEIGMEEQILSQLIMTGDLKKIETLVEQRKQLDSSGLIHRLVMVIDDAQVLIKHLKNGGTLASPTPYSDHGQTHLNNIEVALDMNSDECLDWERFRRKSQP